MIILSVMHMKNKNTPRIRKDILRNINHINSDIDIIPFITMKFLSQKQEKYKDMEDFQKKYGFTFRDYELLTNIIKKHNKQDDSCLLDLKSALNVLKNSKNQEIKEIFSRVKEEKITKKILDDLMEIIDGEDDLIELFQRINYAQNTVDYAGNSIIIPPVIELLSKLATINHDAKSFYDPSSIDAQTLTSLKDFEHATLYINNEEDYFHAIQNLLINEIPMDKVSIHQKEVLVDEDVKKYDTIVSVPFDKLLKRKEMDSIKKYDEYKTKNANSIHLLNLIDHLDDDGIIVTVTTQDLLVKSDAQHLRECLIERNLLDVVIDYDSGFRSRDIIILIINKHKKTEDFLFMNPDNIFGLVLPPDEENIFKSYKNREIISKFSNIVNKDEIIKNDYNLNPKRYVYTLDYEKIPTEEIISQQKEYSDQITQLDKEIEEMLKNINK